MSSTSFSSGCDFEEYFHYADHSTIKTPYYSTMGHPLIYFAQIDPQNISKKCHQREPKKKKNCFKKAFNWYTHEITSNENNKTRNNSTDVPEFVTWLDNKYEEFLDETNSDRLNINKDKIENTTNLLTCCNKQTNSDAKKKRGGKKSRFRSPWRRRRSSNIKDGGDSSIPKNKSFVSIMNPKDLSRPPSDCCLITSCNESNPNLTSDTTFTKKNTLKSKSYSSIFEPENLDPVDVVPLQEGTGNEAGVKANEGQPKKCEGCEHNFARKLRKDSIECYWRKCPLNTPTKRDEMKHGSSCNEKALQTNVKKVAANKKKAKTQNASCQYCDEVEKQTSNIQSAKPKKQNVTCECYDPLPQDPTCRESSLDKGQISNKNSFRTNGQLREVQELNLSKGAKMPRRFCRLQEITSTSNDFSTSNPIRFFTTFVDDMAQTSDHSLCIENNGLHNYPLFMKVICPDKLNEEY